MAGKKSKIIVLAGMIALLVLTGVLNIVINKKAQSVSSGNTTASADFFVTYRADRLATRNQSMLDLDEIIKSGSEEAIKNAEAEKLALTSTMENELKLEGLIKAIGFEDAVVITTSENVSVILRSGELKSEQVAQVLQIVTDETGKTAASVRIIPVE